MQERDRQAARCLMNWSGFSVGMIISEDIPKQESTLSQILVRNAPEKYNLSAKACAGILRRAEKRGKELPTMLREALEEVVALSVQEQALPCAPIHTEPHAV